MRSRRREPVPREQVNAVIVQADDKLLQSVPEAAQRLRISRSLFYELIAAGQVRTIHIGRLCKISLAAIGACIESRRVDMSPA